MYTSFPLQFASYSHPLRDTTGVKRASPFTPKSSTV